MNEPLIKSIRKAYHSDLMILAVEDHMLFNKEIKHALPQHKLVFARTLEDAKAQYDEHMPDMVFLDIDLPDGNGFELLDYIRAREPEAYVVILTGSKLDEDIATSQQKGASAYLIKPFTKARIEQAVAEYLDIREKGMKSLIAQTEQNRREATEFKPDTQ